jgi:hypothetical protein
LLLIYSLRANSSGQAKPLAFLLLFAYPWQASSTKRGFVMVTLEAASYRVPGRFALHGSTPFVALTAEDAAAVNTALKGCNEWLYYPRQLGCYLAARGIHNRIIGHSGIEYRDGWSLATLSH